MFDRYAVPSSWRSPRIWGKHLVRGVLLPIGVGVALSGCAIHPLHGYGLGHYGYNAPAYAHAPPSGHHGGYHGGGRGGHRGGH